MVPGASIDEVCFRVEPGPRELSGARPLSCRKHIKTGRRRFFEQLENLFETIDLPFGFATVFLKRVGQLLRLRKFLHFRRRPQNLFFGRIGILERFEEKVS